MFKKWFYISCCMLFFTGCSLQQVLPAQAQYDLSVTKSEKIYKQSPCKKYVLKVRALDENVLTASDSIYYMVGKYKINSYTESKWSQMPGHSINALVIQSLRRSNIFEDVQSKRSFANADLILQYDVEDFMQYFSEDLKSSYVKVKIHFSLIDPKDGRLLHSITQSERVEASSLDAFGGVKALSTALGDVLDKNVQWVYDMCQKERR